MATTAARVLVIEDDQFTREALVMAFRTDGFDVRAFEHGRAIENVLESFMPDAAVVDFHLDEGLSGLELTRRIRSWGDIPVVLVSGSPHVEDRLEGFRAGVDDFLVKPFSMAELRARVGVALRRSNRRQQRVLEVGDIRIDLSGHLATRGGEPIALRNIEYRLLEMFCRHPGQVLSKVQILEKVWGYAYSDVNLVEVHVSHLRRTLERHGPRVLHTIRSVGYVLQPDRVQAARTAPRRPGPVAAEAGPAGSWSVPLEGLSA